MNPDLFVLKMQAVADFELMVRNGLLSAPGANPTIVDLAMARLQPITLQIHDGTLLPPDSDPRAVAAVAGFQESASRVLGYLAWAYFEIEILKWNAAAVE